MDYKSLIRILHINELKHLFFLKFKMDFFLKKFKLSLNKDIYELIDRLSPIYHNIHIIACHREGLVEFNPKCGFN